MTKVLTENIENKTVPAGKAKKFFAADSSGDDPLRKRVRRAVKNAAVPPDLESKVLNLLRKHL